jgi:hypothetical protein
MSMLQPIVSTGPTADLLMANSMAPNKALVGAICAPPTIWSGASRGWACCAPISTRTRSGGCTSGMAGSRSRGVSPIHNHPWDMQSTVIAGRLYQYRYLLRGSDRDRLPPGVGETCQMATIECGEKARVTATTKVLRVRGPLEEYGPDADKGDKTSYSQAHDEIHQALPVDGTVTLVKRIVPAGGDPDHARVFWEGDGAFVDAAPRPATRDEIYEGVTSAWRWWS